MKMLHTLPDNDVIDIEQSLDNFPPEWVMDFVGTDTYMWGVFGLHVLNKMESAKVWNQITYRFKNLPPGEAAVYAAIRYSHNLIYGKADPADRKLLLYKLFWHTKLDDYPKQWADAA